MTRKNRGEKTPQPEARDFRMDLDEEVELSLPVEEEPVQYIPELSEPVAYEELLERQEQERAAAPPDLEEEEELPPGMERKPRSDFKLNMERELKKIPDYSRGEKQSKKKKRRKITTFAKVMLAFVILGVSVCLSLVILFGVEEVFGMNKEDHPAVISVARDSGLSQIAVQLEEAGVVRSADLFKLYYKLVEPTGSFQYGTYKLNANMSYDAIITELFKYSSKREETTVMFPEGSTLYEMALALQKKNVCSVEDFLSAVNDEEGFGYAFEEQIAESELRYHRREGYAFPDTYNFFIGDNPVDVVNKLLKNFQSKWTEEMEQKRLESDLTLDQVVTLASIVQKESGTPKEMRRVASVYLNRMNSSESFPRLEADPTRKYAEQLELQMGSLVNEAIVNAYNTYEGTGLPPGPICNPGMDALEAVLSPAETPYYFFCNNLETGEYFYAETLAEHERNLVKAGLR